jgi:hypothetical protein
VKITYLLNMSLSLPFFAAVMPSIVYVSFPHSSWANRHCASRTLPLHFSASRARLSEPHVEYVGFAGRGTLLLGDLI